MDCGDLGENVSRNKLILKYLVKLGRARKCGLAGGLSLTQAPWF